METASALVKSRPVPPGETPRHHDVSSIQFHIAESKYRHQDTLDLYLEDIALLRYAEPTLLEFAPENAVMFSDARAIPIRVQLTGVNAEESFELQCELRRDRRIVAQMTVRTSRGAQRVLLDVQKTKLTAGDYELVARLPSGAQETARLRIVTSPWQ